MEEYVIKQKIQMACIEPRAPEGLIQQVILRAKAAAGGDPGGCAGSVLALGRTAEYGLAS